MRLLGMVRGKDSNIVSFEQVQRCNTFGTARFRDINRYKDSNLFLEKMRICGIFVQNYVHKLRNMITTTISDFRKDIKRYLDRVTDNFETLIINRGKDSGVVVISLDEYNSLCATQHELSSKANENRLDSAINKLKKGSTFQKDLIEE